ncbi:MAG TPA: hypothetical protein VFG43_00075, partial [Geminicoccaceae bacterium]|nr:hypothetical protein [Geminicoccaceae bacterium]
MHPLVPPGRGSGHAAQPARRAAARLISARPAGAPAAVSLRSGPRGGAGLSGCPCALVAQGRRLFETKDIMAKVAASSLRKGNVVDVDGRLYVVLSAQSIHPG